ncbi:Predicted O-methyltransferase YrrM [Klenkia soli]|uniref:Predicted O-methyltransferase YrrM n=1 Tax=Klenkia soli TaxID=1052260 RepID=A0A1H0C5U1_9ACTN|nr:class I SAM-dependent methyltransferase [Klenkia soli]SDN53197.1 Predicted O-methyltransferase YrrM [Klenkia soli]
MTSAAGPPPPEGQTPDAAAYADTFAAESPELAQARHRATAAVGALGTVAPVEPAVGATLAVLAAGVGARSVVTIGGGGGVAGLWLLQGMRSDGVLTALDADPTELRAARRTFTDAGLPSGRTRLIFGTVGEVLPRLSPGAYDLVCCAGPPAEYSKQLPALLGLVRAGGSLVLHGISASAVGDRSQRDPQTVAWRELVRAVKDDEELVRAVIPVGAGLLVATKRS